MYAMLFLIVFAEPILAKLSTLIDRRNVISIPSMALLLLFLAGKTASYVTTIADGQLRLGKEAEAVATLLHNDGGRFLIHGWDYRLYSYFDGWNDGTDLVYVYGIGADPTWYINKILTNRYKYIIDVVGYSGLIKDASYKIGDSTIYGLALKKYYHLVSENKGLRVYMLNDNTPPPQLLRPSGAADY